MVQIVELILLLVVVLYTDLTEQKIKNKYIMPFLLLGILTNCFVGSWKDSLLGIVLPFVIFFPFFLMHMFRAGDIKAMMAIGAIMGYRFIGNAIFFIFAVGLIAAIYKMVKYRNARERFGNIFRYFNLMFKTLKVVPYEQSSTADRTAHFPFAIAIAIGCVFNWVAEFFHYLIFFR